MLCARYCIYFRTVKQLHTKINILRFLSKDINTVVSLTNIKNSNENCSTTISQHKDRGYVDESRLNSTKELTSDHRIEEILLNSNNLIPKIETYGDDISILEQHVKIPKALDECTEDVSDVRTLEKPAYTIAKYANTSVTIKKLIQLGVPLYKLKETELITYLLTRNFKKDLFPYLIFLVDCGVPEDFLGDFLTKNPYIFKEDMDDLHTRIRYLKFHKFDKEMIQNILCRYPLWLQLSTSIIDGRLAYLQKTFKLRGKEIRQLIVKYPKIIELKEMDIIKQRVCIRDEMGFDDEGVKSLLLNVPTLWMKSRNSILNTFDYLHGEMRISNEDILASPTILLCRKLKLHSRHSFLAKLGRAQYDKTKPLYISLKALVSGEVEEFCDKIGSGISPEIFYLHEKTL